LEYPLQNADRVRQVFSMNNLTLYQVSKLSAEIYGQSSPHYIPQSLYSELAATNHSPTIHQFLALSRISNYRLCDWLALFGFHLDDMSRLQLLIPWRRTVLLDSSVYDDHRWIPWFAGGPRHGDMPLIAPLGQLLRLAAPRRAKELLALNRTRFRYVKVGHQDSFAFPALAPGSIARIAPFTQQDTISSLGPNPSRNIFLVENGYGLNCGRLRRHNARILLCPTRFRNRQSELALGRNVRILGVVDAEIRPLDAQTRPLTIPAVPALPKGTAKRATSTRTELQQLLRISRRRAGLSFREASAASGTIAALLTDRRYFAAPGTLADYEHGSSPLHHIQKIISLCTVYSIEFWDFIRAAGLSTDSLGQGPLPDELVLRRNLPGPRVSAETLPPPNHSPDQNEFLSFLLEQWREIPLFLSRALPSISNLKNISFSDIYWVGGNQKALHLLLINASFLVVNRRVRTPPQSIPAEPWDQPIYMLLLRDGSYLCGPCVLRGGVLTVHPLAASPRRSTQLRNDIDAEVLGEVTAIVRRLS
jgi:transcriptional regulator with XRE-family HTH domain